MDIVQNKKVWSSLNENHAQFIRKEFLEEKMNDFDVRYWGIQERLSKM